MRLRRYVRQVDHAEAEQALQNQARLQTLEHLLGEAQEWLADMERCIGEWERANALALALSLETTVNVETETPIDIEDNEGDNG